MVRAQTALWLFLVVVAACTEKEEGDGIIDTAQECEDADGYVMSSPGGQIQCRADEEEVGTLPGGIEATICCRERPPVESKSANDKVGNGG